MLPNNSLFAFASGLYQLSAINHQLIFKDRPSVYHTIAESIVRHYLKRVTGEIAGDIRPSWNGELTLTRLPLVERIA